MYDNTLQGATCVYSWNWRYHSQGLGWWGGGVLAAETCIEIYASGAKRPADSEHVFFKCAFEVL